MRHACRKCGRITENPSSVRVTMSVLDDLGEVETYHKLSCPHCGSEDITPTEFTGNYRNLLVKYIAEVGLQEGTDFLGDRHTYPSLPFTLNEWHELKILSAESDGEFPL